MDNKFVKKSPIKICKETSYVWILDKFSEKWHKLKLQQPQFSQVFSETKCKWKGQLYIYPSENYFEVHLRLSGSISPIYVKHTLLLLNEDDKIIKLNFKKEIIPNTKEKFNFKIVNNLSVSQNVFLSCSNIFKIKVIIQEIVSDVLESTCGYNNSKNELKGMIKNKEFCDFVKKFDDSSEIPINRNILTAISPVFSAMIENNFLEKNAGYVKIIDIEKDTMILLLNFICLGNFNFNSTIEEVMKLLSAADKYDIWDLKEFCEIYLQNSLKISNAIDVLFLAELHNIPELKIHVFDFIVDHKQHFLNPVILEEVGKMFPNLLIDLKMNIFNDELE